MQKQTMFDKAMKNFLKHMEMNHFDKSEEIERKLKAEATHADSQENST